MSISTYDITVPLYIRVLKNTSHILTKAEEWCRENSKPDSEIIQARLAPDMLNFAFQIRMFILMTGNGTLTESWKWVPWRTELDDESTFAGLQAAIRKQIAVLEAVKKEDVDGNEAKPYDFWAEGTVGTGPNFKFSDGVKYLNQFVFPNLWFHPTTAYAICRMKGVSVGKGDFLVGGAPFE